MQDLLNIAQDNSILRERTQVGMLDGLVSSQNTTGFEQIQTDTGDGKKRKVKVRYMQPLDEDANTDDAEASSCTAEVEPLPLEDEVEVTSFLRTQNLKFDKANMKLFCESPSEWRGKVIAVALDAFFKKLNKNLITAFLANDGAFPDGTVAPKQIPLINQDAGGQYSADFWGESVLLEDFQDMPGNDRPIVVGAGYLSHYARLQAIGCCNQYGQDVSEFGSMYFFRDRYVDGIAGISNAIASWHPGALQLLTWAQNKGEFAEMSQHHSEVTIVDPVTGLDIDMEVHYDECNKVWTIQFGTYYDLHPVIPADAYPAGHEFEDTNGSLYYQAVLS